MLQDRAVVLPQQAAGDLDHPIGPDPKEVRVEGGVVQGAEREAVGHLGPSLLVHHDRNPDVPAHFDAYRACTADAERLIRLPASSILAASPADWAAWMRARYLLEEP